MLVNTKRKVDWNEEEESDYEDTNASENDEGDNEEPRIKDVLEGLSPEGNSEILLKGKVFATIATERTFTKEQ